jgi:hypothetical protein
MQGLQELGVLDAMDISQLRQLAARLGADHHGVVRVEDLRLAGATHDQLRLLRTESRNPAEGVLVVGDHEIDDLVNAEIGLALGGDDAVISGALPARWLGLPWIPDRLVRIVVLIPEERRRNPTDLVSIQRTKGLETMEVREYFGIPIAPTARIVVDTARQISQQRRVPEAQKLRDVRGVVLGAIGKKACTLEDVLVVLGQGSTAHSKLARRACVDAARGAVAPPEAEVTDDLLTFSVPFYCNVEVWIDGVFMGIVDVWLVGTGVGIEKDSRQEHELPPALDATLVRSKAFRVKGAELEHVTPARYRSNPAAFLEDVFSTVRRRQAEGKGDPPGLELRKPRGPMLQGSGACPYVVPVDPVVAQQTA